MPWEELEVIYSGETVHMTFLDPSSETKTSKETLPVLGSVSAVILTASEMAEVALITFLNFLESISTFTAGENAGRLNCSY